MRVRCKLCMEYENGFCSKKGNKNKRPTVNQNKRRKCSLFVLNPEAALAEAEKAAALQKRSYSVPTWRNYASKTELQELNETEGPRYITIDPQTLKMKKTGGLNGNSQ